MVVVSEYDGDGAPSSDGAGSDDEAAADNNNINAADDNNNNAADANNNAADANNDNSDDSDDGFSIGLHMIAPTILFATVILSLFLLDSARVAQLVISILCSDSGGNFGMGSGWCQ